MLDAQNKRESFEYSGSEDANHLAQVETVEAREGGEDNGLRQARVFCVGFAVFRI